MIGARQYLGQLLVYLPFAAVVGYFSFAPDCAREPPDQALIKFAVAHGAGKRGECREVSVEEQARLAPNMRRPRICPRERLPVAVEFELNGQRLYAASLPPTGLSADGPSRAYERFVVAPGRYRLVARLRDTARQDGFDYVTEADVDLAPGQSLAVDFVPHSGGFRLE
jgi:hypothetical protein